jgi:hypothetical protein
MQNSEDRSKKTDGNNAFLNCAPLIRCGLQDACSHPATRHRALLFTIYHLRFTAAHSQSPLVSRRIQKSQTRGSSALSVRCLF